MKKKHLRIRINQCLELAEASNCVRRKFGAMLIDPERNVVLMDGYNGGPREGSKLCGEHGCLREGVESGTHVEIGCVHAEMNVICNCAANGVKASGGWLVVTGEPCLLCAKLIHHSGIVRVIAVGGGYMGDNGIGYLQENGVDVVFVDGPQDPRIGEDDPYRQDGE